jgi:hypothetical protein
MWPERAPGEGDRAGKSKKGQGASHKEEVVGLSSLPSVADKAPVGSLTAFFMRHPVSAAVGSGLVMLCWGFGVLRLDLWFAAVVAVLITALQWFLWRRGGWARRREERT